MDKVSEAEDQFVQDSLLLDVLSEAGVQKTSQKRSKSATPFLAGSGESIGDLIKGGGEIASETPTRARRRNGGRAEGSEGGSSNNTRKRGTAENVEGSQAELPHRSISGFGWILFAFLFQLGFLIGITAFLFPTLMERVSQAFRPPPPEVVGYEKVEQLLKAVAPSPTRVAGAEQAEEEAYPDVELAMETKQQLRLLKERTRLTTLADRAIVDAHRPSYEELLQRLKDEAKGEGQGLLNAAQAELLRVKLFYSSSNRIGPFRIDVEEIFKDPLLREEADLSTSQLISLIEDRRPERWAIRARAARLLGSRSNPMVNRALFAAMEEEEHLEVLRELVYSFQENTGYRGDFFDVGSLRKWWEAQNDQRP